MNTTATIKARQAKARAFQDGYRAALADVLTALEDGGEDAVRAWLADNYQTRQPAGWQLADDLRLAEATARATGSVAATITREQRNADGTLTTISQQTWEAGRVQCQNTWTPTQEPDDPPRPRDLDQSDYERDGAASWDAL